jgi:soluble lytic murein transglycosylase-like protein
MIRRVHKIMAKLWYNRARFLVTQKGGSMAKQIIGSLRASRRYAKRIFLFFAAFAVSAAALGAFYQPARQAAPSIPQIADIKTEDTSPAPTEIPARPISPRMAENAPAPVVAEAPAPAALSIRKAAPEIKTAELKPPAAQPKPAQEAELPQPADSEAEPAKPGGFVYSDKIPMSYELQEYTYQKCEERGLEYELVLAVMWRESRFDVTAVNVNVNGTQDSGIMQINDVNKAWLSERWGIEDLMDPYQNIDAGTAMLGGLTDKYGEHRAMLAYQYGETGMARKLASGVTTSTAIEKAYEQREVYKELLATEA